MKGKIIIIICDLVWPSFHRVANSIGMIETVVSFPLAAHEHKNMQINFNSSGRTMWKFDFIHAVSFVVVLTAAY